MGFKDNAGKYTLGSVILIVITTLLHLNIFEPKWEAFATFVTKTEFNQLMDRQNNKLDYIINRIDREFDKDAN